MKLISIDYADMEMRIMSLESSNFKLCRAENLVLPISRFSKNPGRNSYRLDCNVCRSKSDYGKKKSKVRIEYKVLSDRRRVL